MLKLANYITLTFYLLLINITQANPTIQKHPYALEYFKLMQSENAGGKRKAIESTLLEFYADVIDKLQSLNKLENTTVYQQIKNLLFITLNPINLLDDYLLELSEERAPKINKLVSSIAIKLGIPTPILFTPVHKTLNNAFCVAINPKTSLIVLDQTVLTELSEEELSSIIAHELAHIKLDHSKKHCLMNIICNLITPLTTAILAKQMVESTLNKTLVAIVTYLFVSHVMNEYILEPILQQQEFDADALGAKILNNSAIMHQSLTSLTQRAANQFIIDNNYVHEELNKLSIQSPKLAKFIEQCLTNTLDKITSFAIQTHPSNESRIEALNNLKIN